MEFSFLFLLYKDVQILGIYLEGAEENKDGN